MDLGVFDGDPLRSCHFPVEGSLATVAKRCSRYEVAEHKHIGAISLFASEELTIRKRLGGPVDHAVLSAWRFIPGGFYWTKNVKLKDVHC